ncbi:DUF6884 domain-containing protein, partial [Nocardioides sp.]|uniref:DUF6884 domain-containing protein n=1 Tax=Nocardioides sp. TaxID=35761 RepID=UPI002734C668
MSEQREVVLVQLGECGEQSGPVGSICTEESFRLRRAHAEESGSRWFVLSVHHGVLAPEEWVTPRAEVDGLVSGRHWRAWADWVAAQLDQRLQDAGGLDGVRLTLLADPGWEVHLAPAADAWGAELDAPIAGATEEERDAWVSERLEDPPPALPLGAGTDTMFAARPGQEAVVEALLALG